MIRINARCLTAEVIDGLTRKKLLAGEHLVGDAVCPVFPPKPSAFSKVEKAVAVLVRSASPEPTAIGVLDFGREPFSNVSGDRATHLSPFTKNTVRLSLEESDRGTIN